VCSLYTTIASGKGWGDEESHLYNTYWYTLFFVDTNVTHDDWNSFIAYDQPLVAEYIFGAALHWHNGKLMQTSGGIIDWHRNYLDAGKALWAADKKAADPQKAATYQKLIDECDVFLQQLKPGLKLPLSDNDFRTGRITSFVFGMLATVLIMVIGFYISRNIIIGLGSAVLFIDNLITIHVCQQVMTDSIWCFFALLCLLLVLRLFRAIGRHDGIRVTMLSVAVGSCLALAVGTKLIAIYMPMAIVIMISVNAYVHRSVRVTWLLVLSLMMIALSAVVLFVWLHPFLYHHPVGDFLKMVRYRENMMRLQSSAEPRFSILSFSERLKALFQYGIMLGYKPDGWLGMILDPIGMCLFIAGVRTQIQRSIKELSCTTLGPSTIISIWMITSFIVIGATVHMRWTRYFLPLIMCSVLLLSLGTETIAVWLYNRVRLSWWIRIRATVRP